MEQEKDKKLVQLENMLKQNMELAAKSRRMTTFGSLCIVAVFIIFGIIIYSRISTFDVPDLQGRLAVKAPPALAPEVALFRNDLLQTLYPKLMQEIQARVPDEMPKLRNELNRQMVLLINDTEGLLKNKITDDTTLAVRESIARNIEEFHLEPHQQEAVDRFVEESVEFVLEDMQPFILQESQKTADELSSLYDTFYNLEDTRLAQYLWPNNPDDATIELFKSMLELIVIKLDDQEVRNFLKTNMQGDISLPVL